MTKVFFTFAFLLALGVRAAVQAPDTTVLIRVAGTQHASQAGSFIPSPVPSIQGGHSASVYLLSGQDVRTTDGLRIIGFSFVGWVEGDATRVQVFALVPRGGAPDVDLRYRPELLDGREFASYRISAGETIAITEMRSLGIDPMMLTSRSFREIAADLMRARDVLAQQKNLPQGDPMSFPR